MYYIKQVTGKKDINTFTELPNRLFKNNQFFVPALSMDERNVFDAKKNPALKYCDAVRYLVFDHQNQAVGRIAGIINHKLNQAHNQKTARFTRMDMIDDLAVSKLLMDTITAWAKAKDMDSIIGPMGFSDMDRMGMLIDGFDQLNLFITIWNPDYYMKHLESLGFIKDVDWSERKITWPTQMPEKVERISSLVKQRYGYRLIKINHKKDIDKYAYEAFEVYNHAFMQLYGFHPLNKDLMTYYIKQVKSLVQLEYLWFVVDKENKIVGFGVIMPSLSLANKKSNGKLLPLGWWRILRSLKKHTTVDFYFIAVDEKHQARGVLSLIMEDAIKIGIQKGVKFAETGPELDDNLKIHQQWQAFNHVIHRKRRAYKKNI